METPDMAAPEQAEPTQEATEQAAPEPDINSLIDQRFDQFRQEIPDLVGQQYDEPYGYEEPQDEDFDIPEDGLTREQFDQLVNQRVEAALQERLSPIEERVIEQDLSALEQELPELQDERFADSVVEQMIQSAQALGLSEQQMNRALSNPAFIRQTYYAMKAQQRAAMEEPPAAEREVVLEQGAANAAPAADDPVSRLLNAGRGDEGRSFWTGT